MTTPSIEQLERQIEDAVAAHIAAVRRAASAAMDRALGTPAARAKTRGAGPTRRRASGGRRSPEEIAALGERLYEVVRAHPGETMTVLAPHVGSTPRELHRPMMQLKRSGRVRSAGERHQARYFPM